VKADGGSINPAPVRRRRGWLNRGARGPGGHPQAALARRGVGADSEVAANQLYGALDLGTNNCRLLVAQPARLGFEVVDAFSRIVRLGEGVSQSGALGSLAMARTISALRVCANKLKWWQVPRARLIATEACRTAVNGAEFIARVREEVGLVLEVIDRETEARLAVAGAAPLIAPEARNVLVFDIGGGSTELMWISAGPTGYQLDLWTSLPEGVVTIAEAFGGIEVDQDSFTAMRLHVRPKLEAFVTDLAGRLGVAPMPDHLLGTSGTVTTISGMHMGLKRYDRSRVDGTWLHHDDIVDVTAKLLAMSYEERAASPCIGHDRADLVLAGCAILEEIRRMWPVDRLRVADRGLREGLLTSMMTEDGTYGREPDGQEF
jgi:exopolyphosphatase / guanosine-5'-triphosphate,3'-diphosphate pyrophosphatase